MHELLIAGTFLAMILAPCIVAFRLKDADPEN